MEHNYHKLFDNNTYLNVNRQKSNSIYIHTCIAQLLLQKYLNRYLKNAIVHTGAAIVTSIKHKRG